MTIRKAKNIKEGIGLFKGVAQVHWLSLTSPHSNLSKSLSRGKGLVHWMFWQAINGYDDYEI